MRRRRRRRAELGRAGQSWAKLGPSWAKLGLSWVQAGPSWASFYGNNEKRGKRKKEQKLSGENTPKSEIGKISYQNWKSEPKNSPKAFGELKKCLLTSICHVPMSSWKNKTIKLKPSCGALFSDFLEHHHHDGLFF